MSQDTKVAADQPTEGKTFTQAELDAILEGRLAREQEKSAAQLAAKDDEVENIKRDARMRLAKAEGRPLAEDFVQQELAQQARNQTRVGELDQIFDPKVAGSSARSQKLYKADKLEYRRLIHEWKVLKGWEDPSRKPEQLEAPFKFAPGQHMIKARPQ